MLSLYRRLSTVFRHRIEEGVAARWILLSSALAGVGVVGVYLPVPPVVNYALAVFSVVLLGVEVAKYSREQHRITFVRRQIDDYSDVRRTLDGDGRSEVLIVHGQTFVLDLPTTDKISDGSLTARLLTERYRRPRELDSLGNRYRRTRLAKNSLIFDGPALGWKTSIPDLDSSATVDFMRGTYFDRLATDYFAAVDTRQDGVTSIVKGRSLYVNRHGALREFGDSWLFNGVGVSTLAITSDGMFVLTGQSDQNVGEPGLLAPSGSGSLEPRDFRGAKETRVAEIATTGANRELGEETSIDKHAIDKSFFLGFGRWLNKAACPELFSVTFLSADSHSLKGRKSRPGERVYVDGVSFVRPSIHFDEWRHDDPLQMLPESERSRVSLPLGVNLALLARAVRSSDPTILDSLRKRFE